MSWKHIEDSDPNEVSKTGVNSAPITEKLPFPWVLFKGAL
jgi:hypothetical protein